jgi:RHS repeat-associated protein
MWTRGRETRRIYGNGVRQETHYDQAGRVILIRETDSRNSLLRAEGYLYDDQGRRSHSIDDQGSVTKYEYDRQSRLSAVLYPWTKEKSEADRKEAEEAGLYFTPDKGNGERYSLNAAEQTALRDLLNNAGPMRGNVVSTSQLIWRESYTYDRNGNRAAKTMPWGTIRYEYDTENRLVRRGDIVYINDKNGNTLSEKGLRYEAKYEYNGQNRMVYSEVTSHAEKTHVVNSYGYDALGRRVLERSITGETLRTLYDGQSFEVIREGESFRDGSFTTRSSTGGLYENGTGTLRSGQATGERYRWVTEDTNARARAADGYTIQSGRYGVRGVALYGNGEAVALSYSSSASSRSMYLGKDIMGSVRSVTVDTGTLESRYEYDAFGQPYKGELSGGMNLGYAGKPCDPNTGLYNYGYRDYRPQAARFTTADPIRDGNNWYAYVNNDPVNWADPFGLRIEALKNLGISAGNPLYYSANLAASLTGPLAPIMGITTQAAFSTVMYVGFAVISIFSPEVRADMNRIGWNPFNTDEKSVLKSNSISFYKGAPVIRYGDKGTIESFSFGAIFLARGTYAISTIKHERGHNTQLMLLGLENYIFGIGLPSILSISLDRPNHSSYLWEQEATTYGGE